MPFISVIIPSFNRQAVVLRAIHSVINQSFKDFELIVVDDGSSDETELVLSELINSGQIRYFKQKNSGVSAARNLGVLNSVGEWISFLDSDDEWLPDKLKDQCEFLSANPLLSIAYGQEIWIRNGVRVNQKISHQKYGGQIFDKCVEQCLIAPSSVIMKKSLFNEMGGFDQDFLVCEDYDLWLKISSLYEVGLIEKPLIIKYGGHLDQLSTSTKAFDMWRLRSLIRILKLRDLSVDHKENVIDFINKKALILIKGYEKYGNSKGVEEVKLILEAIRRN